MPALDTFVKIFGQGLLAKKQQDDAEDARKQDIVAKMALDSLQHVRPEDMPKAWQHIEKIVTAKTAKQSHEALGAYMSSTVSENPQQEQQVQTQNDLGKAIFDQGMPEGHSTPQDPAGYAGGKIRIKTLEGDEQRKVNIYTAQQKVVTANRANLDRQKAKDKLAQIEAQNKGKVDRIGVPMYDPDTDTTSVHYRVRDTGEVKTETFPGSTGQVYSAQQRAETAKAKLEADIKWHGQQLDEKKREHDNKMDQWNKSRALKAQMYVSKSKDTSAAAEARMYMAKIKQANINANEAYALAAKKDTPEDQRQAAIKRIEDETKNAKELQDQLEIYLQSKPDYANIEDLSTAPTTGANPSPTQSSAPAKTSGPATIKSAKASFKAK